MTAWSRLRIALGIVTLVVATLSIVIGLVAAAAAIGVHTLVGRSGVLAQDLGVIEAPEPSVAVLVDGVEARVSAEGVPRTVEELLVLAGTDTDAVVTTYGTFVLLATPTGEGDAFMGIAAPGDVDAYLDGAAYAVAERSDDGAWRTLDVPGDATPGAPGTSMTWTGASSGRPAMLDANGLAGRTLVVMRPDASPGVSADLRLEYRVPDAPRALRASAVTAAGACVGGLLLVLLGAWLVVGPRPPGRHA